MKTPLNSLGSNAAYRQKLADQGKHQIAIWLPHDLVSLLDSIGPNRSEAATALLREASNDPALKLNQLNPGLVAIPRAALDKVIKDLTQLVRR